MSTALAPLPLYALAADLRQLQEEILEAGGELSPELEERLDRLPGLFEGKVERTALAAREFESSAASVREAAARMSARAAAMEKAAVRIKEYLREQLDRAGVKSVRGDLATVTVCEAGTPSIRWGAADDTIPEPFRKTVIEHKLDSRAALAAHRGGQLPDGFVVRRGRYVKIS